MTLLHGNNLDLLRAMPDNSVHSIVCDPPYGLGKEPDALAMLRDWIETGHHDVKSKSGFMGKTWDAFVPQPVQWRECLRVLIAQARILGTAPAAGTDHPTPEPAGAGTTNTEHPQVEQLDLFS